MAEDNTKTNMITNSVAKVLYKTELEALTSVLQAYDKPKRSYSILFNRDDSVCLICQDGNWIVYYSQRGQETCRESFESILDACSRVICKFADSDNEETEMLRLFRDKINKPEKKVPIKVIFNAVQNAAASVVL